MNDKQIIESVGYRIGRCDPKWGGTYSYSSTPGNGIVCGYKTEKAAIKGAMRNPSVIIVKMKVLEAEVAKLRRENKRLKKGEQL